MKGRLYLEWKSYTDNDPKLQASSRTGDYAVGPAAARIREMGESIAPLLLEVAQTDFLIIEQALTEVNNGKN